QVERELGRVLVLLPLLDEVRGELDRVGVGDVPLDHELFDQLGRAPAVGEATVGAMPGAAVLPDFFERGDDAWVLRQPLLDGRKLALLDQVGQHRRFLVLLAGGRGGGRRRRRGRASGRGRGSGRRARGRGIHLDRDRRLRGGRLSRGRAAGRFGLVRAPAW